MLLGNFGRSGHLGIPYYEKIAGWGEFYASGSRFGSGEYSDPARRQNPRPRLSGIPTTETSTAFLYQTPSVTEDVAVDVVSENWYMAKNTEEGWTSRLAGDLDVKRMSDEAIKNNSTPYFAEWCFYTAEPVSLEGREFKAVLKTSICEPNSLADPNHFSDITIRVIADSYSLLSHVARSGFICPVDPNGFAPYTITTDSGINILVCPLPENAELTIDVEDMIQFLPFVTGKWLTSCSALDVNKDGIVNFGDLP
jgi:hypothetical protein